MNTGSLERIIPAGVLIALDTSAVLAYLDGSEAASPAAVAIIDGFVRPGRNAAVISTMTVTECLVRAFAAGSDEAVLSIETFLGHFPNLSVQPTDFGIARDAARIRAATRLPTPDATVIAAAMAVGAGCIVANDDGWAKALRVLGDPVPLCHLMDHRSRP